jgi:aminoglycoside phosphotransferase (APT) family kinase protein
MEHMGFYYAFGLFRLAVIAQQIYFRYFHGQTQDQRFATLGPKVGALIQRAEEVIETGKL